MTVTINLLIQRNNILEKLGWIPIPAVQNVEWIYLMQEETRNSIMIEWYFANKKELKEVIQDKKDSKNSDAILGYFDAATTLYKFWYQKYINNEKIQLNHSDIKAIHSIVFQNTDSKNIWNYRSWDIHINKAKIQPPLGTKVPENMDYFLKFVNKLDFDENNIISSLTKMHTLFESIHPFEDWNWRVGRILLNYILLCHGYPNIIIKWSKFYKEKYFKWLEEAENWLYKYFPNKLPKDDWTIDWKFDVLENIVFQNLIQNIDHIILSKYNHENLIPVSKIVQQKWYTKDYGRQLVNRWKIIAKKIWNEWYSTPELVLF